MPTVGLFVLAVLARPAGAVGDGGPAAASASTGPSVITKAAATPAVAAAVQGAPLDLDERPAGRAGRLDSAVGTPLASPFPAHFRTGEPWHDRWIDAIAGPSQRLIGRAFERVAHDEGHAASWFARAARHGDAEAAYRLGIMYAQGRGGLDQDAAQAGRLLHAAAEEGYVDAQGALGLSYLLGHGMRQSFQYAYMWISLASEARGGASVRTKDMIGRTLPADRLSAAEALVQRCRQSRFRQCDDESWP